MGFFATRFLSSRVGEERGCYEYIVHGLVCCNENTKGNARECSVVVASNVLLTWGKGIGQKDEETDDKRGLKV